MTIIGKTPKVNYHWLPVALGVASLLGSALKAKKDKKSALKEQEKATAEFRKQSEAKREGGFELRRKRGGEYSGATVRSRSRRDYDAPKPATILEEPPVKPKTAPRATNMVARKRGEEE